MGPARRPGTGAAIVERWRDGSRPSSARTATRPVASRTSSSKRSISWSTNPRHPPDSRRHQLQRGPLLPLASRAALSTVWEGAHVSRADEVGLLDADQRAKKADARQTQDPSASCGGPLACSGACSPRARRAVRRVLSPARTGISRPRAWRLPVRRLLARPTKPVLRRDLACELIARRRQRLQRGGAGPLRRFRARASASGLPG